MNYKTLFLRCKSAWIVPNKRGIEALILGRISCKCLKKWVELKKATKILAVSSCSHSDVAVFVNICFYISVIYFENISPYLFLSFHSPQLLLKVGFFHLKLQFGDIVIQSTFSIFQANFRYMIYCPFLQLEF